MKSNIHPKTKLTKYKCATCGSEIELISTTKAELVSIDVCSNCHPFYKGGTSDKKVKGRAEKLSSKFEVKTPIEDKATNSKTKKSSKKIITDLDQLKA